MRTLALVKKEFLQFWRDPALVAVVLWCFTLDIYLCARGFSLDVSNYPIAIYNLDGSQLSENLLAHLREPEYRVVARIKSDLEMDEILKTGKALTVLVVPNDFS